MSGVAVASILPSLPTFSSLRQSTSSLRPRRRVAIFYEPAFPTGEISPIKRDSLVEALDGYDIIFFNVSDLKEKLSSHEHDVFINPYGSRFPKDAYRAISKYLISGGNWVNLGGIPLSVPVVKQGEGWRNEIRQTAHRKKLGITQAFPVSGKSIKSYLANEVLEGAEELMGEFTAEEIYELYVRFTVTKDFPSEDGSAGARDAVLRPLVFGLDGEKRKLAAPFIQIDRLQGEYAGGRWILANFKGTLSAKAILILTEMALQGSMELTTRSSFACYNEGEMPSFTIQFRRPKGEVEKIIQGDCRIEVLDEHRKSVGNLKVKLLGKGTVATGYAEMDSAKKAPLSPALYQVNVKLKLRSVGSDATYHLNHTTGFWVLDKKLLASGTPLTVDKNYFLKEGKPIPVTGTTYMTSDVHRKFLFEPNPYLWNEDFTEMKRAGVNMVRTGIWTAWKNYMLDVGAPNETSLRALDAFVLTARKHDIPLIFTFFAFLPEQWGGVNAYLDPRSVNAQKEFITIFAHRYRTVNDIIWDFINEPSFCSPKHLWSCRPNYDKYEKAAWNTWLKERYQYASDEERMARLQEQYRTTADESTDLPSLEEFENVNIFNESRPIKVIDYRLFAQDKFIEWVREMTAAVRSNGNPHQLITVGQDEGGTGESPSPQFFSKAVDFTCIHNWWLNDDLVWDSVVTKTPGKPNLVEETGVMFYERMDGSAWRSEQEARNLLERKLAISLGTAGAGFLQWIWNTNPYMTSDNEAAIGLFRVDGTAKPELDALMKVSAFFAANRHLMKGKKEEDVLMVIPHSQLFSTRNYATEATRRCVRVMHYRLNTPMAAVSEYRLESILNPPKLIILPSPRTFNEKAWNTLLQIVEQGSTLLVTGIIDADDHWVPVERLRQFDLEATTKPVTQEEFLSIDGQEYQLSYRGEKIQRVEKAVVKEGSTPRVVSVAHGKGRIIWSPLPVEISDTIEPTVALYEHTLKQADIAPIFSVQGKDSSVLIRPTVFDAAVLYTFVSECDRDTELKLIHNETGTPIIVTVPAQRSAMLFISRKDGRIMARME